MWRVAADSSRDLDPIREAWADGLSESDALLAFKLSTGNSNRDLGTLVGRHGEVLARSRKIEDLQAVLLAQLQAMDDHLPNPTSQRYELRTLRSRDAAVLLGHGVGAHPALPERSLDREGLFIVDSPYTDVRRDSLGTAPTAKPALVPDPAPGHAPPWDDEAPIIQILWHSSDLAPTPAMVAHTLAVWSRSGTRGDRLRTSAELAATAPLSFVDGAHPGAVIRAARSVL